MAAPTAIIYARVSTSRQAEDGLPIASQLDQCRRKAESLGAVVLREFCDEGLSGRSSRRPQFQQALAFCGSRPVSYFIVWSSSRFARNRSDAPLAKMALKKCGTKLVYVTSPVDTDTDEGWLNDAIMETMDELYSRNVAKDTRRSMMKNAADGYFNGGHVPFGYSVVTEGKRKRLMVNELEAPLVQKIFAMYVHEHLSMKDIAIALNESGLRKRGERWNKKGIGLILTNHRYVGRTIFNRRDHVERITRDPSQWVPEPALLRTVRATFALPVTFRRAA